MIKGAAQRRAIVGIISIGEYLAWRQPSVFKAWRKNAVNVESLSFKEWKRLMEEPPKPGKGGD